MGGSIKEEVKTEEKKISKLFNFIQKTVLATAKKLGSLLTSLKFGVPEGTIKTWITKENNADSLVDRRINNARPANLDLDEKLLEYISALRMKGVPVDGEMIKREARSFQSHMDFKASNGWLDAFLKRNNLVKRKKTHVIQKLREDYKSKVELYFEKIK